MNRKKQEANTARKMIREFDKRLLAAREYDGWIYKVPFLLLEGMCLILGLCAVGGKDEIMLYWSGAGCGGCIYLQMRSYVQYQRQSVYQLLSYCPVTRKDIFLVRLEYLKNMMIHRLCLWIGLQVPFVVYQKELHWENLEMVLVFFGISLLYNFLLLLPPRST